MSELVKDLGEGFYYYLFVSHIVPFLAIFTEILLNKFVVYRKDMK